ncbi:hypothetical protein ACJ41O_009313 [Fusarium nematophilum]
MPAATRKLAIHRGNLHYEVKPYDIEELLTTNGFDRVDKIHISVDPVSARNPGYCFVDFADREAAEHTLASLSATLRGRSIKVGPCEPKKPRNSRGNWNRSEESTSRRWGDWSAKPESKGEERGPNWALDHFDDVTQNYEGRRLYVGGLGKMIDQTQHQLELREIFAGFTPTAIGKRITPHESTRTQRGNHHYCFVDFETKEEASAAVEALNGQPVSGGNLKVSLSKKMPEKLVDRLKDGRNGRPEHDGGYSRPNRSRFEGTAESSNAMASSNWRRRD